MNKNINEKMKLLSGKLSNKTQVSIRASDKTGSYLIQPKFDNVEFETGQKYYTESIFDNFFQVASPSFFQVNISQVEQIFSKLQNLKIFNENQVVVDAYCGVGTFTCLIAPYVKKIIGIEESYSAVVDAKENSKNLILGDGNIDGPIMIIGEAPGPEEVKTNKTFQGEAGILLSLIHI